MNRNVDPKKLKIAIATLLWAGLLTYVFKPYVHNNQDAINVIVTVFSILAGFLVAVITLIGDPASLPAGSWRIARIGSELTYNRLVRHKWLFILYLTSLVLIFVSTLLKDSLPWLTPWLETAYLFLAIAAFILSFQLPSALMQLQRERIEQEIQHRRKLEGISDDED